MTFLGVINWYSMNCHVNICKLYDSFLTRLLSAYYTAYNMHLFDIQNNNELFHEIRSLFSYFI